ncbi:MAG: succinate dehydrogenase assembly factor 2 [Pseudomonadota bacterium]
MKNATHTAAQSPKDAAHLRKLRYRAWHRGTREMDLLLGPFADDMLEKLDSQELNDFESLMDVPDGDLQDWILHNMMAPDEFETALLKRIRNFNHERRA